MAKAKSKAEVSEKIEEVAIPEVAPQPAPEAKSNDKHKVDTVSSLTGKTFKRYTY
jgi:hypothetical protein